MTDKKTNNNLDGVTLKMMLQFLIEHLEWGEMARRLNIRCFTQDPSLNSSLKFLRKTDWARAKVETMYLSTKGSVDRKKGST